MTDEDRAKRNREIAAETIKLMKSDKELLKAIRDAARTPHPDDESGDEDEEIEES